MSDADGRRRGDAAAVFAQQAHAYAAARPRYPSELFDWIAATCRRRERAWDCAAGSGQAASGLAARFGQVHATDLSLELIRRCERRDNIFPSVGRAEACQFGAGAFDLVAVAQALHWLELPRFWKEVARVANPGALFCAWGYVSPRAPPEIEAKLVRPFRDLIAPFWAPENLILWRGYRPQDVGFPFGLIPAPDFAIRTDWTLAELTAFMSSWSACRRARNAPSVSAALDELLEAARSLAPPSERLEVVMPLQLLAGRI